MVLIHDAGTRRGAALRRMAPAIGPVIAALLLAAAPAAAQETDAAKTAGNTWVRFLEFCGAVGSDPAGFLQDAADKGSAIDRTDDNGVVAVTEPAGTEGVKTEVYYYGMPGGLQTSCAVTGRDPAGFAAVIQKYAMTDPGLVEYGRALDAGLKSVLDEDEVLRVGGELTLPGDPGSAASEIVMPHYRAIVDLAGEPRYATIHIAGGAIFIDTMFHPAEVPE
ncbi:hypothetical protein OB2597_09614 [Pseudooceanicola batsensis HTCC2597]|uniref:Lipoprotein n=1 Tax=Pseudooceanicola batsensis (strain ATCC BAA-863 / DSM 15984 / KCTC 12145 / HTCC2597) TaxID=252305 RepID=A3TV45_PSEBH|nr:hypothetical protein [Pseudooceanicola batsensis]EAQ04391.1 hypothetical protein OB2597_09614 [Pseudooceanicola batsensis HTCC2597]